MKSDLINIPPGFWAGVQQLGIAPCAVVRKAKLSLSLMKEPAAVDAAQYSSIWQAYADLVGDAALGITKLVTAFESAQYPPTVLATYHARDYRDALHRMTRYKQLCPPESLRLTEESESGILELGGSPHSPSAPPVLIGITLAFLLELGRRGTGHPISARCVELSSFTGDATPLEAYFGCPVRTGSSQNRLTLHRRDLDRPFKSYNQELLEILTPVLDRSLRERARSISEKVKRILKRNLTGGRLDIRLAAYELGMSDRTLQRRLANEGTTFKKLLSLARQEQAREYLADPKLNIEEVAFLVGWIWDYSTKQP